MENAQSRLASFNWLASAVAWADEVGPLIRDAIMSVAPVAETDGGRLRDSIYYQRNTEAGAVSLTIASSAPYAGYVVHGTGPHPIDPVAAFALHFFDSGGGDVFAMHVDHPGTAPNPFPSRGYSMVQGVVRAMFIKQVSKQLNP